MEKIGIFGGSFNPVHNEHYKIAKGAIEELNLDKLYIVPTNIAPHKQNLSAISGEDRLNMLEICFANVKKAEICDYEIKSKGVSYTYLTILHFKKLYPSAQIYFMMGSDMLENFPTWKNPEIITKNASLVLVERRGEDLDTFKLVNKIKELYGVDVAVLNEYGTTFSATEIRVRASLGLSIEKFLPKGVEDYIKTHNLYAGDEYYEYVKSVLPNKRLNHTAGVIITAIKYAKLLNVDVKKAELSALLHDIAKYENVENFDDSVVPKDCPSEVAHQFIGERIARCKLKVKDEDVLNAIKYHTTGRPNMSLLEKIIYVADLLEPSRAYKGVDELRKAVQDDFESGFKICIEEVLEFLQKQGGEIYPLTTETTKFYKQTN